MTLPVRLEPAGEVCRGCAGTGIDHSLSPREYQLATMHFYAHKPSTFNGATSHQVASLCVTTAENPHRERLHGEGPLSYVLAMIEHYRSIGFEKFDVDPEWLATIACGWCGGTGVPSLSVHTLRAAVRA